MTSLTPRVDADAQRAKIVSNSTLGLVLQDVIPGSDHHSVDGAATNVPLVARSAPIVIVGNGPVGSRAASELMRRVPGCSIVIYGEEPCESYDRVRLSSWLAGDIGVAELFQPLTRAFGTALEQRIGYRVVSIDRNARTITDSVGREQPFDRLVLATGSRAYVPPIPGVELDGVYTLRDMDDAIRLMSRRARSHRCVVIGGGLLGLEAARGMQPGNTRVTLIEHGDRLMGQQLDSDASLLLESNVRALGIEIMLRDGIEALIGIPRVTGVRLHSGRVIDCDTVVVATGIRSEIELARKAGLAFGRGITVDDHMTTSDPCIFAIGECAEHRGEVYGLVAPGFEQAAILAAQVAGEPVRYQGSVLATRLKVVGTSVFSIGPVGEAANPTDGRSLIHRDAVAQHYRKIVVRRHRLIGAIGIGDWTETVRLQTCIGQARRIYPWNVWRFKLTGRLWPEPHESEVAAWPASTTVCQCTGITRGRLGDAIACGALSVESLGRATGAGTVCGSCQPLLGQLIGAPTDVRAPRFGRTMTALGVLALSGVSLILLLRAIPYSRSVADTTLLGTTLPFRLDQLWRDGLLKQVSGFLMLGIAAVATLLSLRKRTAWINRLGSFVGWRTLHVTLGALSVSALIVHTGMRLGHGLNLWLMLCFLSLLAVGGLASAAIGIEHRLSAPIARQARTQAIFWHILLIWPLPVLLVWHVLKSYWY